MGRYRIADRGQSLNKFAQTIASRWLSATYVTMQQQMVQVFDAPVARLDAQDGQGGDDWTGVFQRLLVRNEDTQRGAQNGSGLRENDLPEQNHTTLPQTGAYLEQDDRSQRSRHPQNNQRDNGGPSSAYLEQGDRSQRGHHLQSNQRDNDGSPSALEAHVEVSEELQPRTGAGYPRGHIQEWTSPLSLPTGNPQREKISAGRKQELAVHKASEEAQDGTDSVFQKLLVHFLEIASPDAEQSRKILTEVAPDSEMLASPPPGRAMSTGRAALGQAKLSDSALSHEIPASARLGYTILPAQNYKMPAGATLSSATQPKHRSEMRSGAAQNLARQPMPGFEMLVQTKQGHPLQVALGSALPIDGEPGDAKLSDPVRSHGMPISTRSGDAVRSLAKDERAVETIPDSVGLLGDDSRMRAEVEAIWGMPTSTRSGDAVRSLAKDERAVETIPDFVGLLEDDSRIRAEVEPGWGMPVERGEGWEMLAHELGGHEPEGGVSQRGGHEPGKLAHYMQGKSEASSGIVQREGLKQAQVGGGLPQGGDGSNPSGPVRSHGVPVDARLGDVVQPSLGERPTGPADSGQRQANLSSPTQIHKMLAGAGQGDVIQAGPDQRMHGQAAQSHIMPSSIGSERGSTGQHAEQAPGDLLLSDSQTKPVAEGNAQIAALQTHNALRAQEAPTPLSLQTRRFLQPLVGIDLTDVRVHRGVVAEELTTFYQADALTVGDEVAIAAGYSDDSPETLGLLAHEFTHLARRSDPRFVPPLVRSADISPTSTDPPLQGSHELVGRREEYGFWPLAGEQAGRYPAQPGEEALAQQVESRVVQIAQEQVEQMTALGIAGIDPGEDQLSTGGPEAILGGRSQHDSWNGLPAPWEPLPDWLTSFPDSIESSAMQVSHRTEGRTVSNAVSTGTPEIQATESRRDNRAAVPSSGSRGNISSSGLSALSPHESSGNAMGGVRAEARALASDTTVETGALSVQRAGEERSQSLEEGRPTVSAWPSVVNNPEPDLDALAQKVHAILKQRLAAEQRRAYR